MSKKKTHEEYVEELAIKNPNIEVLGRYVNAITPIAHRCRVDDYKWDAIPNNVLRGSGCPRCANNIKKTTDEYISELANINSNIVVIGEYVDAKTPIEHYCKIHGVSWFTSPISALRGGGCIECRKEKISNKLCKTHEEYVVELSEVHPNIEVLDKYINANTPILHRCNIDAYEWNAIPNNLLFGFGCPKCANNIKKTTHDYISEVSIKNPDVEVLGLYINSRTPILHRCKIDGYEWFVAPMNILSGQCCPQCQESKGERQIRQWLENRKIEYLYQKIFDNCKNIKPLPFDFYLPKHNTCIEYDGGQHFFPVDLFGGEDGFKKQQLHDEIKNQYCKDNNIPLLRIPYFKNIEDELENFLFI